MIGKIWEIDKPVRRAIEQGRGVHAKHAGENTFMLGPRPFLFLYWGPELERNIQGRLISQGHWDILPLGIFDIEPIIRGLGLSHKATLLEFFLLQQVTQGSLPVTH